MPNHKSAEKRLRQDVRRRERNRVAKSAMRTEVKKVDTLIAANQVEEAQQQLRRAESKIGKTAEKGIIHKRAASRKISRLAKQVNKAKIAAKDAQSAS